MILSSLVNPDPEGFIKLDENLGKHIGARNVEAFHEDAGNLTMKEFLSNSVIVEAMMKNPKVMRELNAVVSKQYPKNEAAAVLKGAFKKQGARYKLDKKVYDAVADEILTNPVINDATMRNPEIMRELNNAVSKLYKSRMKATGK